MDSLPPTDWKPPSDPAEERRLWGTYRAALSQMSLAQLMAHASQNAALLQAQAHATTSEMLSEYQRAKDNPVLPRASMAPRSSADRPEPASRQSQQPSSLDLLSSSRRLGPALATKLIVASARAANRRTE